MAGRLTVGRWSHRTVSLAGLGAFVALVALMASLGVAVTARFESDLGALAERQGDLEAVDDLMDAFIRLGGLLSELVVEARTEAEPLVRQAGEVRDRARRLEARLASPEERELAARFGAKLDGYRNATAAYAREVKAGGAVRPWERSLLGLEREASALGRELRERIRHHTERLRTRALARTRRARVEGFALAALGVLGALLGAIQLRRALARPVRELIEVTEAVAAGDLSRTISDDTRGEIGDLTRAIGSMVARLRGIVGDLVRTTQEVEAVASRLDGYAGAVSEGAESQDEAIGSVAASVQQADAIFAKIHRELLDLTSSLDESSTSTQQIAAAVQQISALADGMTIEVESITASMVQVSSHAARTVEHLDALTDSSGQVARAARELAGSSEDVGRHAAESRDLAEEVTRLSRESGEPAVAELVRVTHLNRDQVESYGKLIRSLGQRSAGIAEILDVIRDVAEKTDLLSLNAAIIAAQAGEHGSGFGVVAEEIRSLSSASAASVAQVEEVVRAITTEVEEAVLLIDRVIRGAESGIEAADQARQVLEEVVTRSSRAEQSAREIAVAAEAQVHQSQQIFGEASRNAEQVAEIQRMVDEQKQSEELIVAAAHTLEEIATTLKEGTGEQASGTIAISQAVENAHGLSREISRAMDQGSAGSRTIAQALTAISGVAEGNVRSTRDLRETVDALRTLSGELLPVVRRFKLGE